MLFIILNYYWKLVTKLNNDKNYNSEEDSDYNLNLESLSDDSSRFSEDDDSPES